MKIGQIVYRGVLKKKHHFTMEVIPSTMPDWKHEVTINYNYGQRIETRWINRVAGKAYFKREATRILQEIFS